MCSTVDGVSGEKIKGVRVLALDFEIVTVSSVLRLAPNFVLSYIRLMLNCAEVLRLTRHLLVNAPPEVDRLRLGYDPTVGLPSPLRRGHDRRAEQCARPGGIGAHAAIEGVVTMENAGPFLTKNHVFAKLKQEGVTMPRKEGSLDFEPYSDEFT